MRNIFFLILLFSLTVFAETPLSQLPLNNAPATVGNSDSFPYVKDGISKSTYRLYLKDILGIPAFTNKFSLYAPLASPIFTGTVTAPVFVGNLNGNATNVTGIVTVAHGGTGAASAPLALTNLLPSQIGLSNHAVLSSVGGFGTWVDAVLSVNGYQGAVTLVKSDVGLSNVDNTSDATKNVAAVNLENKTLLSPLIITPTMSGDVTSGRYVSSTIVSPTVSGGNFTGASMDATVATNGTYTNPSLLGSPTATTAASNDSSTRIATTAFVKTHVPITTKGDLLTRDASGSVRVPVGTNGQTLVADSTTAAGIKWATNSTGGAPDIYTFASGSGTYTVGVGTTWIRVKIVGGGGGGGNGNSSAGGTAGNTTFGSGTSVAFGGQGGSPSCPGPNGSLCLGGSGGSISIATPGAIVVSYSLGGAGGGGGGFNSFNNNWGGSSGVGGSSCMGGGAKSDSGAQGGSFGGGGGGSVTGAGGGGGGGGGCGEFIIKQANLSASYTYSIGTFGAAGASNGGGGYMVIEEYH